MNTKRAVLAVALSVVSASAAWSGTPATGLGQAWPNATDASLSPHYHAYLFARDGIEYVQINDLNGTVLAAIAATPGTVLVLPIGVDASHTNTAKNNVATRSSTTEAVYQDKTVSVTATPQSDGSLKVTATPALQTCPDPGECGDVVKQPQ
jgi:hypothetical protein